MIIVVVFILGRGLRTVFEVVEFMLFIDPISSLVSELGRTRTLVTLVRSLSDRARFPFPNLFLCAFSLVTLFLLLNHKRIQLKIQENYRYKNLYPHC